MYLLQSHNHILPDQNVYCMLATNYCHSHPNIPNVIYEDLEWTYEMIQRKLLCTCRDQYLCGQKIHGNYSKETAGELKNIIVLSKREGHFALRANQDPNFPAFTILHSACVVCLVSNNPKRSLHFRNSTLVSLITWLVLSSNMVYIMLFYILCATHWLHGISCSVSLYLLWDMLLRFGQLSKSFRW